MRKLFHILSLIVVVGLAVIGYFYNPALWLFAIVGPLVVIGLYDTMQSRHTILRNFPVLGHLRYFFEFISPEIQQYFIETNTNGKPFSRKERSIIYQRAKGVDDTTPFGTQLEINVPKYEGMRHSIYPAPVMETPPRVIIGGKQCKQPYSASLLNISAMSYGSLSDRAVMALNAGAKAGGFYHNTGEGGLTRFHLSGGGDIVWQLGTAYFGCRTEEGNFDPEKFRKKASNPQVKMIELKISQGAKPGHGGVLPAVKNTPEIAEIRDIRPYTTVLSPPGHNTFSDAPGLLRFIQQLRELSDYKPVGFKLCLGKPEEFEDICKAMISTGILPDFITLDGAEGGTGAAPLEFTDSVGIPIEPALMFVVRTLKKYGLREEIRIIASGKVISGITLLKMLSLGANLCNSARGFMFSLGCIQALRCNNNKCPTGVATQDPELIKGLVVEDKVPRVVNYQKNTLRAAMELLAAAGKRSLDEIGMDMFIRGDEFYRLENQYFPDSLLEEAESRN